MKYAVPEYRKGGHLANLFEPLWNLFAAACRDPDAGQVICVLDALDECVEPHQRILAKSLGEFCTGNESSVDFRVLITSRPDSGLQGAFAQGSKSDTNIIRLSSENEQEVTPSNKKSTLSSIQK